jgi:hypothetical protein
MDNMPIRERGTATSNSSQAARRTEERSFLDDDFDNEPTRHPKRSSHTKEEKEGGSKRPWIMGGIVAAALVVVVILVVVFSSVTAGKGLVGVDSGKYQAVFFTNGQVYFGKLKDKGTGYMSLTDIFYLQTQDNTSDSSSKNPQQTANQQTPNVQLVKLGNEIHGPNDEMIISKDQVLFFENLKDDGKVAQTIKSYQSGDKK